MDVENIDIFVQVAELLGLRILILVRIATSCVHAEDVMEQEVKQQPRTDIALLILHALHTITGVLLTKLGQVAMDMLYLVAMDKHLHMIIKNDGVYV